MNSRTVAALALGAIALTACGTEPPEPGVSASPSESAEASGPSVINEAREPVPLAFGASFDSESVVSENYVWRDHDGWLVLGDTHGNEVKQMDVALDGGEPDGPTGSWQMSADASTVVFYTEATNVVEDDTNGFTDVVLVKTTPTSGTRLRVSLTPDGRQLDGEALTPRVNSDGSFVTFTSNATNLAEKFTNDEVFDEYLFNVATGTLELLSIATDGATGNGSSWNAHSSTDGRYVVFESRATNLVEGDTNDAMDVFLRDTASGTTTRVSMAHDGSELSGDSFSATISADGRHIVYMSDAPGVVEDASGNDFQVYLYEVETGAVSRMSNSLSGGESNVSARQPIIAAAGYKVMFVAESSDLVEGDTNDSIDVFMYYLDDQTIDVVSHTHSGVPATGISADATMTGDGRFVIFSSTAEDLATWHPFRGAGVFAYDYWWDEHSLLYQANVSYLEQ